MSRRVRDVPPELLTALPDPCATCVFWEAAGAAPGAAGQGGAAAKQAWWQATQLEWGVPAKGIWDGERLLAYALYGPGRQFPATRRLPAGPSDDALLLATLWVEPRHRGAGLSRTLLQVVLREAHRYRLHAVEAYGLRAPAVQATCVVAEQFLLANGFTLVRDHPAYPLLRINLRQTARESVGSALQEVLSNLRRRERVRAPAAAPRAS